MASLGLWPSTIRARTCRLVLNTNQVLNSAPFGGSQQVVDRLNDFWLCDVTLPVRSHANAAAIEAFLASFHGQVNWADLWHLVRPLPRGTMRGSALATVGAAAQNTNTLTLKSARARENQYLKTDDFNDAYWTKVNVAITPNADTGPFGDGKADKAINTAVANQHVVQGFLNASAAVIPVGVPHNLSGYFKQGELRYVALTRYDGVSRYYLAQVYDLQTGTVSATPANRSGAPAIELAPNGYWRCSVAGVTTTATNGTFQFRPAVNDASITSTVAGDGVSGIYAYGMQVTEGLDLKPYQWVDTALVYDAVDQPFTTLLAGDVIGVGGQLLMLAADAVADATGTIVVQLVNRLRTAVAAGTPVVYNKPTAPFRLLSHSGVSYVPGHAEEVTLTLGEKVGP